jgi:5''-3'' exonuclease (including N-terminal domain of PolI)
MQLNTIEQLSSYPSSDNRLLIVDWSSLSYHMIHSIPARKRNGTLIGAENAEEEVEIWKKMMFDEMIHIIKLFNPMDVILTREGKNGWRHDYVRQYYGENTEIYYDDKAYYVRFDNRLYVLTKGPDDEILVEEKNPVKDSSILPEKHRKLKDMPPEKQRMFWEYKLPNGYPLLPVYKGKRSVSKWELNVEKKDWLAVKDSFIDEIAPLIRAKVVGYEKAEGDDVAYVAVDKYKDEYDSIVLVTRDSDMNQLLTNPKLVIYNHVSKNMTECPNAKDFLEIKILKGDNSDNINGMALPGKKNKLSDGGATAMFESGDYVDRAKSEGWYCQYIRNQKLINLAYSPMEVKDELSKEMDNPGVELASPEELYSMKFVGDDVDDVLRMRNRGYFCMNTKECVKDHFDAFRKNVESDGIKYTEKLRKPMHTRSFGSLEGIFNIGGIA